MKKDTIVKGIAILLTSGSYTALKAQEIIREKPNFVWFMAEDVSKHYLSLYN